MKSLLTGMYTASLQASCASASVASNQVPDGVLPGEDCSIQVTCEIASCLSSVHISYVSLKQTIASLTAIEATHWSNIISKFGTFSCTGFYLVMF